MPRGPRSEDNRATSGAVTEPLVEETTGRMEQADLERHVEAARPERGMRVTAEMEAIAIEALCILSSKDERDLESLEEATRSSNARQRRRR